MKLVFSLAFLIASLAVLEATAEISPIENELEELDLLLNLDAGNYAFDGLVTKIREALQRVLDRVKTRLGEHKELFEQFRAKIEEVQEKIKVLVKQGGAQLAQLVNQIREKLQALITGVFDKLHENDKFYETEQGVFRLENVGRGLSEFAQSALENLKKKVAQSKEVSEDVKGQIEILQEQITQLSKEAGDKAIRLYQKIRIDIRAVYKAIQKTALYEGEAKEQGSLISRIVKRVADLAKRALNKLKERLSAHEEFFEELKAKFEEVRTTIGELGKTVGAKALEVAKSLRQKVTALAQIIKEKLAGVTYEIREEQ